MKRAKQMKMLLGTLVVVSILSFVVLQYQEKQEEIENTNEIILQIDSDSVSKLSWSYDDETLAFFKNDKWLYEGDEAFPVDEEKIESLLSYFSEMSAAFVIKDVTDFSQYGLDHPECDIYIATDNKEYDISIGDYSTMDAQRYVSIGDGNVYLVNSDPLAAFQIELNDMIDNDEIPSFDQVDSISFSGSENYDIVYKAYSDESTDTICSDDVYFKEAGDELLPLDTEKVDQYLETISGMSEDTYVTYNANDEELAKYGLDEPELNINITYHSTSDENDDEETTQNFVLHISRDAETKANDSENEEENEDKASSDDEKVMAYARVGESKIIYEISETSYNALMAADYNDLRHDELFTGDFSDVTQIDVTLDNKDYTINVDSDNDKITYQYGGEEIDMTDFQTALEAIVSSSFTDENPGDDQELSLTLHFDNKTFSTLEMSFYRYDGENCLALIDGEPVALVSRTSVVDLKEAVNAIVL